MVGLCWSRDLGGLPETFLNIFYWSEIIKIADAASAVGSAYRNIAYYNQAEELYQAALVGYEKELGKDHTSTLDTAHNITRVFYRQSTSGEEKALGKDHLSTLSTVNNMAVIFDSQGRYDEALEYHQKALAEKEKALGMDHPAILDTVHNIALVFDNQDDTKKLLSYIREY
ncbi:hypothetical protein RUND412_000934 [Rhizina undulata]